MTLLSDAVVIRDETTPFANTATRVGTELVNIVTSYRAESVGASTNGTVIPVSKLQATIPSGAPTGTYLAQYDCLLSTSISGRDFGLDFEFNGAIQKQSIMDEISDAAFLINENRVFEIAHVNGLASVLDLLFYRGAQATTITIAEATILIGRKS